jgi:hypothetical protein
VNKLFSRMFDPQFTDSPVSEGGDPSPAAFWLKSFFAGLVVSAPAWMARVAAFLF